MVIAAISGAAMGLAQRRNRPAQRAESSGSEEEDFSRSRLLAG
jgi:hypothetical protein